MLSGYRVHLTMWRVLNFKSSKSGSTRKMKKKVSLLSLFVWLKLFEGKCKRDHCGLHAFSDNLASHCSEPFDNGGAAKVHKNHKA